MTERRVPELIPVLGSQPAGDVSHKPGGRLPLLSTRPAVTHATLKRAATNFAACLKAKLHYTDPTRTRHGPDPTRTKSAHIVRDELNSTTRTRTRTRHGPDRTRKDPHGLSLRRNSVGSVRVRSGPCSGI